MKNQLPVGENKATTPVSAARRRALSSPRCLSSDGKEKKKRNNFCPRPKTYRPEKCENNEIKIKKGDLPLEKTQKQTNGKRGKGRRASQPSDSSEGGARNLRGSKTVTMIYPASITQFPNRETKERCKRGMETRHEGHSEGAVATNYESKVNSETRLTE